MRRRNWVRAAANPFGAPLLLIAVVVVGAGLGAAAGLDQAAVRAAGNRSLLRDLDSCPFDVGLRVVRTVSIAADTSERPSADTLTESLSAAIGSDAPPPTVTLFGGVVDLVSDATGKQTPVQLVSRTGAATHVVSLEPATSSGGLLIQRRASTDLGLHSADSVQLAGATTSAPIEVDGVIDDLYNGGFPGFWCSLYPQIYGSSGAIEYPLVIVDQATLIRVATQLGKSELTAYAEYAPVRSTWSLHSAPAGIATLDRVQQEAKNDLDPLGQAIRTDGATRVDVLNTVETAHREMAAASGVISPFTVLAVVILLACAVLCAVVWLRQGERGRRVLVRHGMGAGEVFVVTAVEMAPAALLASVAGLAARWTVLRRWNAWERYDWSAMVSPTRETAFVALTPVLIIGATAVLHSRSLTRTARTRRPWLMVTAGLCLLTAAVASYLAYRTRSDAAERRHAFTGQDFLSALAPAIVALVVALALVSDFITNRVGSRPGRWPRSLWLAWMRVRGDRQVYRLAVVALASTATFVAVVGISTAAVAKATRVRSTIGLGASVVYSLEREPSPLVGQESDMTVVTRVSEPTVLAGAKPPVDVLGVDPNTFARAAAWQENFSDQGLTTLLARLDHVDDPTAALVIGSGVPDRFTVTLQGNHDSVVLQLHVVARPSLFPSQSPSEDRPLVVVNRSLLTGSDVAGGVQLWTSDRESLSDAAVVRLDVSSTLRREARDDSVTGAISVRNALHVARVLGAGVGLVIAFVMAVVSRRARRPASRREQAVLGINGVTQRRVVATWAAGPVIVGLAAVGGGAIAAAAINLLMPNLADQTPYLVAAPGRTWVIAPLLLFGAVIMLTTVVAIINAVRHLRLAVRYADLVHHD